MAKNRNKKSKKMKPLRVIQSNATGIDIGAIEIYVAVPEDRDTKSVRCFARFTEDLHKAVKWLKCLRH